MNEAIFETDGLHGEPQPAKPLARILQPGAYETSCGEAWLFGDGEFEDNPHLKFCPFCGGRIEEVKA